MIPRANRLLSHHGTKIYGADSLIYQVWGTHGKLCVRSLKVTFRTSIDSKARAPVLPIREYTMMEVMNQLTDKTYWETKVFDQTIVDRWKSEILSVPGQDVSERMFDYVSNSVVFPVQSNHCSASTSSDIRALLLKRANVLKP